VFAQLTGAPLARGGLYFAARGEGEGMRNFSFWVDIPEIANELIGQTLAGTKTATVRPASSWGVPLHDYDSARFKVGDLVELRDAGGAAHGQLRLTEVYDCTFGDIPERLWRGETNNSADEFRADHRSGWPHVELTLDLPLIAIHFRLISRIP
jgi:uncharacterized protein YhfF